MDRSAHVTKNVNNTAGKQQALTENLSRNPNASPQKDEAYKEEYVIHSVVPHNNFSPEIGCFSNYFNQSQSEITPTNAVKTNKLRSWKTHVNKPSQIGNLLHHKIYKGDLNLKTQKTDKERINQAHQENDAKLNLHRTPNGLPMKEGDSSSDSELAPALMAKPTSDLANYIGVKSVQYIKMGHSPTYKPSTPNKWDHEITKRETVKEFATDLQLPMTTKRPKLIKTLVCGGKTFLVPENNTKTIHRKCNVYTM